MSAPADLFDQICDLVADITGEDDIRDEPDIDLLSPTSACPLRPPSSSARK